MATRRIRNSSITKYLRCRRSWMLAYVRNLETRYDLRTKPAAFDTGTAVHVGLEALYKTRDIEAGVDAIMRHAMGMYDKVAPDSDMDKWEEALVTLPVLMLQGYQEWREETGADVGETLVAGEQQLEASLGTFHGDDVILYGTIDQVLRDSLGQLIINDFKTVGPLDENMTLATNWQINNYELLVRATYDETPVLGRHTQLRRVKRTARAKPPFYGKQEIVFSPEGRATHLMHLQGVVADMVRTMQKLETNLDASAHHYVCPPSPTRDCNWDCSFKHVCPMMDNGGDWEYLLAEDFRQRDEKGN